MTRFLTRSKGGLYRTRIGTGATPRQVSRAMMRCSNCNRDYPGDLQFCHQCGERLHPATLRDEAGGEPIAVRRRLRAVAPRRARPSSSSLLLAVLILLGAGVSL